MSENASPSVAQLVKVPTGIAGLDEILDGGLPAGRSTLVMGNAGAGKTVLSLELLYRGWAEHGEPGVYVSFEEGLQDAIRNTAAFGWNLGELVESGSLAVVEVPVDAEPVIETGAFDLSALFARIDHAIRGQGARRLVLDGPAALLERFASQGRVRAELSRLLRWLREREITTVVTTESLEPGTTRFGVEPFVTDCVIELARVHEEESTSRWLNVAKYRGSAHGTDLYPFAVGAHGLEVWPVTSAVLDHEVSGERVSSGIARLDEMLGGEGYFRGSTILVSGTSGTGKSTLGASFVNAACARGEKALLLSFEESPQQIIRNTVSVGFDLERWAEEGLLVLHSARPSRRGLEQHLLEIDTLVRKHQPSVLVLDPISSLEVAGTQRQTKMAATRLIDRLKRAGVTVLLTYLNHGDGFLEVTSAGVSSIVDTWLILRDIESAGERNKAVYVLKSRGMAHSNQLREFRFTERGIELADVYVGPEGVLTGTARISQEARERAAERSRAVRLQALGQGLESRRRLAEARIAAMQAELEEETRRIEAEIEQLRDEENLTQAERGAMERKRSGSGGK